MCVRKSHQVSTRLGSLRSKLQHSCDTSYKVEGYRRRLDGGNLDGLWCHGALCGEKVRDMMKQQRLCGCKVHGTKTSTHCNALKYGLLTAMEQSASKELIIAEGRQVCQCRDH
jgi:hypothetical protein